MQNIFHNKRNIKLISLLFIVAMLVCTFNSNELFLNGENSITHDNGVIFNNNFSEISLSVSAKADNFKELSLKKASAEHLKKASGRSTFSGLYALLLPIIFGFSCALFFFLYRAVRCNRLIIISYIHDLDGMKP